jgi:5'-methylthioadenosine phosphorylase
LHADRQNRWEKPDRWHIGVIGGSGLADGIGLDDAQEITVASPFGEPSGPVTVGRLGGVRFTFLARHGAGHRIPPGEINYRANIDVLKRAGVTDLVSLSACGSYKAELYPGLFVLVDQFVDRTGRRESSFFGTGCVAHVAFGHPVGPRLRARIAAAATAEDLAFVDGGTLVTMAILDARRIADLQEPRLRSDRDDGDARGQARPRGRDHLRHRRHGDRL